MDFHSEIALVAYLRLVSFRIELPLLALGGAGCHGQGVIRDRAQADAHAP